MKLLSVGLGILVILSLIISILIAIKILSLSVGLGILSCSISIIAIVIAIISDRMMRAIANLEYDEKLAIMADHSEKIKKNKSWGSIERIKNDFSAVSNLQKYADEKKKEKLIEDYIIPILETILNDGEISSQRAVAVYEIINIALKYNIATEKIKSLRQKMRNN